MSLFKLGIIEILLMVDSDGLLENMCLVICE